VRERERLDHAVVNAGKFKICRVGKQTGDPEKLKSKAIFKAEPPCSLRDSGFFLKSFNITEDGLLYSKSSDLNVNHYNI
jgi:hypothetical protein